MKSPMTAVSTVSLILCCRIHREADCRICIRDEEQVLFETRRQVSVFAYSGMTSATVSALYIQLLVIRQDFHKLSFME